MAKKKNRKRRNIIIAVVIVVLVLAGVGLKMARSGVEPIEVQTESVGRQRIVHKVTASGTIQPERQVDISANISALIMEIMVEEGDSVLIGQHLISLDRTRPEAAAEQAQSRLKSARATLVQATATKDRDEKLFSQQLISSQQLEASTAQFQLAESGVELSRAALKSSLDDLSKTSLLVPSSGVVTEVRKEAGEMALGSMFQADVLMTIADLSKMEVVVQVNENDVVDVSVGDSTEIEIDAFQDTLFSGIVQEIAHVAQTAGLGTQEQVTNFNVKVKMLNVPISIRQGMSATVNIITDVKDDVLAIPIQALTVRSEKPVSFTAGRGRGNITDEFIERRRGGQEGEGNPGGPGGEKRQKMVEVVFVMSDTAVVSPGEESVDKSKGSKFAEQRQVKVGLSSETYYEVLSGLTEGEQIVTGSYKAISRELQHNGPIVKKEREKGEKNGREKDSRGE